MHGLAILCFFFGKNLCKSSACVHNGDNECIDSYNKNGVHGMFLVHISVTFFSFYKDLVSGMGQKLG